jgi:hypothetical protein
MEALPEFQVCELFSILPRLLLPKEKFVEATLRLHDFVMRPCFKETKGLVCIVAIASAERFLLVIILFPKREVVWIVGKIVLPLANPVIIARVVAHQRKPE